MVLEELVRKNLTHVPENAFKILSFMHQHGARAGEEAKGSEKKLAGVPITKLWTTLGSACFDSVRAMLIHKGWIRMTGKDVNYSVEYFTLTEVGKTVAEKVILRK